MKTTLLAIGHGACNVLDCAGNQFREELRIVRFDVETQPQHELFERSDWSENVIVLTCLGGRNTSLFVPLVESLQEKGRQVFAVVTTPMAFEGKECNAEADKVIDFLSARGIARKVFDNNLLFTAYGDMPVHKAFMLANERLVEFVAELVEKYGLV